MLVRGSPSRCQSRGCGGLIEILHVRSLPSGYGSVQLGVEVARGDVGDVHIIAGLAHDQFRPQDQTGPATRLASAGEMHYELLARDAYVVETDQAQLEGDIDAVFLRSPRYAQGHFVVGAEDGCRGLWKAHQPQESAVLNPRIPTTLDV